ncbi:MAG: hypothetical protein ACUVV0_04375 [Anaerolineae bacterium]
MGTTTITLTTDQEVVIVPLATYNALLAKLEDLEDIKDMLEALKEPARPFEEYLAELEARGLV